MIRYSQAQHHKMGLTKKFGFSLETKSEREKEKN